MTTQDKSGAQCTAVRRGAHQHRRVDDDEVTGVSTDLV